MGRSAFYRQIDQQIAEVKTQGLYKHEHLLTSAQNSLIAINNISTINLCSNNYLGFANHPRLLTAARKGLTDYGFGMASVRFISGTQKIHTQLEAQLSEFLGMDDVILYSSCFDANAGLFGTLLGEEDVIISDELNNASVIDGIRLCKAKQLCYANNDMADLEKQLKAAQKSDARHILIATDGVFSMDGIIANLQGICDLGDKYGALIMVDDSHAIGVLGENGRGSFEHCNVMQRVDIITGTLSKALGGASGGFIAAKKEVVSWLRQRSRPYLFSNSLPPAIITATMEALTVLKSGQTLRNAIVANSQYFREQMTAAGFTLTGADHAIIPVIIGDTKLANELASRLLKENIYVISLSFPIVPEGQARIRIQMSAIHTREQLDRVIESFTRIAKELEII